MFLAFCCVFVVWSQYYVAAVCPPIITKKEWDGEKATNAIYLSPPVDLVIVQHTATQACSNDKSCAEIVRDLQKLHKEKVHLWDIGPSFLIGGNGKVYEGRGWNHVAVHTYGYNNQSLGIAFIGNFDNQEPPGKAMDAAKALIQCGVEDENRISPDHSVIAHNQLLPTESPGKKLAAKLMSWPDWKADTSEIVKRVEKESVKGDTELIVPQAKDANQILSTPKHIDQLTNSRDVITELINNLRQLALLTLKTVEDFTTGVANQASLFFEDFTSRLADIKDKFTKAVSLVSNIPGVSKCVKPIQDKANGLYDNTDAMVRACADARVKEVEEMVNNLGTLSSETINFSNTAVEQTKNCTELNFGIQAPTSACLNSVTTQVQSATNTFDSQKNLSVKAIKTALDALPAALELCSKKHLSAASSETTTLISSITGCSKKPLGGFPSFG